MTRQTTLAGIAGLIMIAAAAVGVTHKPAAPAQFAIEGIVTDETGKPLRAAIVKAIGSSKSLSVYTNAQGRFRIEAARADYDVEAFVPGFHRETVHISGQGAGPANFALKPGVDIRDLNSADVQGLLPQDAADAGLIRAGCTSCHSLDYVAHGAGWTADSWHQFLPMMTARLGYVYPFKRSENAFRQYSAALEKYFGPASRYFGEGQSIPISAIKRPAVPDEVLKATFTAWKMPGAPQSMPHSIVTDADDNSWIAGNDTRTNSVLKFDPKSERFTNFPIAKPATVPHTPCLGKDGTVYMTLTGGGKLKMVSINPKIGKLEEHWFSGTEAGPGNCRTDPDGNLWFRAEGLVGQIMKYDVKTRQFSLHPIRMPTVYPAGSRALAATAPGDPAPRVAGFYDVAPDSKGRVWETPSTSGLLVRYDPHTGKTDWFEPPVSGYRGAYVDKDDNLWAAAPWSHKVVKADGKTGAYKLLDTPTRYGEGYGMVVDQKRGYLWMGDSGANTITRINLKTEEMVEYPLPTPGTHHRLGLGIDSKGRIWYPEFFNSYIVVLDPKYDD